MRSQNIKQNGLIMIFIGLFGGIMIAISILQNALNTVEIGLCAIVGSLSILAFIGGIRDRFNINIPLINHIIGSKIN